MNHVFCSVSNFGNFLAGGTGLDGVRLDKFSILKGVCCVFDFKYVVFWCVCNTYTYMDK